MQVQQASQERYDYKKGLQASQYCARRLTWPLRLKLQQKQRPRQLKQLPLQCRLQPPRQPMLPVRAASTNKHLWTGCDSRNVVAVVDPAKAISHAGKLYPCMLRFPQ